MIGVRAGENQNASGGRVRLGSEIVCLLPANLATRLRNHTISRVPGPLLGFIDDQAGKTRVSVTGNRKSQMGCGQMDVCAMMLNRFLNDDGLELHKT